MEILLVLVFLLEEAPTVHRVAPATDPFSPGTHRRRELFFLVGKILAWCLTSGCVRKNCGQHF